MNFLASLNESQFKAVVHEGGPLFVIAGAGTGKTKTLTTRIAYLILKGVEPKKILAVTFTNKAAKEMKQRVIEMTGPYAMDVWLYTFHAFGLNLLRKHIKELPYGYQPNFNVIDEDDAKKIISDTIKQLGFDIKMVSAKKLRHLISLYKTKRMEAFEDPNEFKIYQKYQEHLYQNQMLDFDDLICYTLELLTNHQKIRTYYQTYFEHILIDEFQDTDYIQYQIIKILGAIHKQLFIVGDPDQSIYSFRGANYENANALVKDFNVDQVILDQNYRSTNKILKAANQLISKNRNRVKAKNLESNLGLGHSLMYHKAQNDMRESFYITNEIERLHRQGVPYDEMVILYRNNALSRIFEEAMIKQGIPYIIYGGISFYERKEIKDALAYIRVILDPSLNFYLKRIVNVPRRSIGQISVEKLEQKSNELGISMFDAISYVDLTPQAKKSLLEFKTLILEMQGAFNDMETLSQIMPYLMEKTKYTEMLKMENDEIAEDRIDNLRELQNVFVRGDMYYEGSFIDKLQMQLDQIALYTDLDQDMNDNEKVKLSTYHQVKGLEFNTVFMVVLEEGIFPSEHAIFEPREMEEERRVAYVGMTRAKERLYLSYAEKRMIYGRIRFGYPSRFIEESQFFDQKQTTEEGIDNKDSLLKAGDKVMHHDFGLGIVVTVKEDVATIAFSMPYGIKHILESHPSLKKIRN